MQKAVVGETRVGNLGSGSELALLLLLLLKAVVVVVLVLVLVEPPVWWDSDLNLD